MFASFITNVLLSRYAMFLPFAKHHRSEKLCGLDLASTFINTDIPSHRLANFQCCSLLRHQAL